MSGMTTLSPMNTTSATSTAEASCAPPAARPPTTLPSCPCPAAAAAAAAAAGPPPLPSPSSSFPSRASLLVTCVNMRSSAFTSLYASLTRSARRLTDPPSVAPTDPRPLCLYASTTRRQCRQSNAACEGGKKHACAATSSSVSFSTSLEICALVAPARCTTRSASNAPWKNSNTGACDLAMVARADPRSASSVATARASPPGCDIDAASFATARSAAPAGANARETYSRHCASSLTPSAARPIASHVAR